MKQLYRITITDRKFWQHERLVKRLQALDGKEVADGVWECRFKEIDPRDLEGLYGPILQIELSPEQATL
jgi:hypothetical protein